MQKMMFRGRNDKIDKISKIWQDQLKDRVLDVGCDQCYMKPFVRGEYTGVDKYGNPDVVVNLDEGLPFDDYSFDTVVALDVLEHLNNIHQAFDSICRVSRQYLIIGLPNLYEWRFRVRFILGKTLSGKHALTLDRPDDRHRWLFSSKEAKEFIEKRASINSFKIIDEMIGYYDYRRVIPRLISRSGMFVSPIGRNMLSCYYGALLERKV